MSFSSIKQNTKGNEPPCCDGARPSSLPSSLQAKGTELTLMVVSVQEPVVSAAQVVVKLDPTAAEVAPEGSEGSGAAWTTTAERARTTAEARKEESIF